MGKIGALTCSLVLRPVARPLLCQKNLLTSVPPSTLYLPLFYCTGGALALFLGTDYSGSKQACLPGFGPFSVPMPKYLGIPLGTQELRHFTQAALFRRSPLR